MTLEQFQAGRSIEYNIRQTEADIRDIEKLLNASEERWPDNFEVTALFGSSNTAYTCSVFAGPMVEFLKQALLQKQNHLQGLKEKFKNI